MITRSDRAPAATPIPPASPRRSWIDAHRRRLCRDAVALAGGALILSAGTLAQAGPRQDDATNWLAAPPLPAVSLRDHSARPWTLAEALDGPRVVVISFFFTGCRTVCPPQTALLREAALGLRARGQAHGLRMIGLSVDPLGDGPPQLREFAQRFDLPLLTPERRDTDGSWLLLTGERAAVDRSLIALGQSPGAPEAHASLLWVIDVGRGRWTRTSSLNPPEALVGLLASLEA